MKQIIDLWARVDFPSRLSKYRLVAFFKGIRAFTLKLVWKQFKNLIQCKQTLPIYSQANHEFTRDNLCIIRTLTYSTIYKKYLNVSIFPFAARPPRR